MSAGPGPPKSPAPNPPRRSHSVTARGMTRYRSVWSEWEHNSVLDFGRDWRAWDVDIFRDDETESNATTDTGTSISIDICIGIVVDKEAILDETQAAQTSSSASASTQQQQQQERPASVARRRTAPLLKSFAQMPQTLTGAPQLTSQWQWHDLKSASASRDEYGHSEPGVIFSLVRPRSGSRSPVPGFHSTQTPLNRTITITTITTTTTIITTTSTT
ncbi:hypothetical protein LZ32DRAFT_664558 [Colletotrichum eremochloae]|nr:hypothetical protein LZ32DRAFT_664558 [Colletotrichum eremochloae]